MARDTTPEQDAVIAARLRAFGASARAAGLTLQQAAQSFSRASHSLQALCYDWRRTYRNTEGYPLRSPHWRFRHPDDVRYRTKPTRI